MTVAIGKSSPLAGALRDQLIPKRPLLRVLTCGSVDDGKSTLIGRLLHDSQLLLDDQLATLVKESKHRGMDDGALDFSLLVDGLQAEREQGITIDVAYRYFTTPQRRFIVADCPGHEQYTRNMVTGASNCDVAIILIDAVKGVQTQTRRHSFVCSLLGIKHVIVAVNKMDLVEYSQARYKQIQHDYLTLAGVLNIPDIRFVPMSALHGEQIIHKSKNLSWFRGSTLIDYLESTEVVKPSKNQEFRFPVQLVSRPNSTFRGFQGNIVSGSVSVGETVRVLPSGTISTIASILTYDQELESAQAPMAVTLTLNDNVDVSRGCMLVRKDELPHVAYRLKAHLVWMNESPLVVGKSYRVKFTCKQTSGKFEHVNHRLNVNSFAEESSTALGFNEIGSVELVTLEPVVCDLYQNNRHTGSFIVIDRVTNATVAAGMVTQVLPHSDAPRSFTGREDVYWHGLSVTPEQRRKNRPHQGYVLWYTGLSGAGKSTIANAVDALLTEYGCMTYVLDGDNLRHGLNADLDFSEGARAENVRRLGEVSKLFVDAGLIVSTAAISPYAKDRNRVRALLGERYIEVFIDAPLEECERRDPKGLYKAARAGSISDFTGVSSPYEKPEDPTIYINTAKMTVAEAVDYIVQRLIELCVVEVNGAS